MFGSITFDLNLYFGSSTTFVYFSLHPLWIYYAARCVHFTLFLLWEQMYTSGSTFIKEIKTFVWRYISMSQ